MFVGLSSDEKPTIDVPEGTEFFETNTGRLYVFGNGAWSAAPQLPASLGQKPASGSLPVVLASDQTLPAPNGGTLLAGTKSLATTVAAALSTTQGCKGVLVQNDPDNTVDVLIGDSNNQTYQLGPGDSVSLAVSDVSQVYAKNVSSISQSVNWLAIV